jgi:2-oxoglutarate ferredoxin oxidoreductase subunit beta
MYGLRTDWPEEISPRYMTLEKYTGAQPRWCPGCGDHAVLTAVQRLCRDEQLLPEQTVFVSGIGCSSRFPHYMNTYGFHGLHGRALPVACGIRARRPDLHLFVATGDGDCCSIGAGHWIHALRYNMKMVVMVLDNSVYGLTKNQTSPTSLRGRTTNTHPRGAWLDPLDPVQTTLSVTNASFVAQTVDWSPPHLLATLRAAHHHPGLAFVRIIQRCASCCSRIRTGSRWTTAWVGPSRLRRSTIPRTSTPHGCWRAAATGYRSGCCIATRRRGATTSSLARGSPPPGGTS